MQNNYRFAASPWISMDLGQWEVLTQGYSPVPYHKRSILYHQNDPSQYLFIVKSGRLRITSYQESGAEKQLYIAEKGTLVGESAALTGRRHTSSAMAIVDSMLYRIPKEDLLQKMPADWELAQSVIALICRKKDVFFRQVLDLSFTQSSQRIAQQLLDLCQQYGTPHPNGVCIGIRFTHSDVATMVNTSRVTVSNILTMFSRKGILSKKNGLVVITDLEALQGVANGGTADVGDGI